MQVKYTLIPKVSVPVWDTPRPKAMGAIKRRDAYIGFPLQAFDIFEFDGVKYAMLVPLSPSKPEWVRVEEPGAVWVHIVENDTPESVAALLKQIVDILKSWKS